MGSFADILWDSIVKLIVRLLQWAIMDSTRTAEKRVTKKTSTKKVAAKRVAVKKTPAKKPAVKRTTTKKTAVKKTTTRTTTKAKMTKTRKAPTNVSRKETGPARQFPVSITLALAACFVSLAVSAFIGFRSGGVIDVAQIIESREQRLADGAQNNGGDLEGENTTSVKAPVANNLPNGGLRGSGQKAAAPAVAPVVDESASSTDGEVASSTDSEITDEVTTGSEGENVTADENPVDPTAPAETQSETTEPADAGA